MSLSDKIQMLMLPGLASDERLFAAQRARFPEMIVPAWPSIAESVRDPQEFAQHCWNAWTTTNGALATEQPYLLGGTSVGGLIAIELAWLAHQLGKPPAAVLLISSCRSWQAVPRWYGRWAEWSNRLPKWIASKLFVRRQITQSLTSDAASRQTAQLVEAMYQSSNWAQLQMYARLMAAWRREEADANNAPFPIHQLHGRLDALLPKPSPKHATLLLDAGHWMPSTHADIVNNWIDAILRDLALQRSRPRPG
jgi:alpha-beta hydrolase superfamily lysophospholipase